MSDSQVRVLVAYASRYGATAGIAEAIGDMLRRSAIATEVRRAVDVEGIEQYTAVVLGSAVYLERWQPDAVQFVRRHRAALACRRVWLFSSGPIDRSADEYELPMTEPVAAATAGLQADGHRTFGGRLSPESPAMPNGPEVVSDLALRGGFEADFRNFERIRAWAEEIARAVRQNAAGGPGDVVRNHRREPVTQQA